MSRVPNLSTCIEDSPQAATRADWCLLTLLAKEFGNALLVALVLFVCFIMMYVLYWGQLESRSNHLARFRDVFTSTCAALD